MRRFVSIFAGVLLVFHTLDAHGEVISVDSTVQGWQDSGMDITAGQTLNVLATGTVFFGWGAEDYVKPDGVGPLPLFDGTQKLINAILLDTICPSLIGMTISRKRSTKSSSSCSFPPVGYLLDGSRKEIPIFKTASAVAFGIQFATLPRKARTGGDG